MDKIEVLLAALAKFGRHASILLCSNRTGYVKDSSGKVVFHFSSLEDLVAQLNLKEEVYNAGSSFSKAKTPS